MEYLFFWESWLLAADGVAGWLPIYVLIIYLATLIILIVFYH